MWISLNSWGIASDIFYKIKFIVFVNLWKELITHLLFGWLFLIIKRAIIIFVFIVKYRKYFISFVNILIFVGEENVTDFQEHINAYKG